MEPNPSQPLVAGPRAWRLTRKPAEGTGISLPFIVEVGPKPCSANRDQCQNPRDSRLESKESGFKINFARARANSSWSRRSHASSLPWVYPSGDLDHTRANQWKPLGVLFGPGDVHSFALAPTLDRVLAD
jgi:hypothetical protein